MAEEKCVVLLHEKCEGAGIFEDVIKDAGVEFRYIELFNGADVPEGIRRGQRLLIMGGPMNVYQEKEYPFLREEDLLIKEALKEELPVLGICLGAQLIAKAAGARVREGKVKEIGWYKIRLTEEGKRDRIFSLFKDEFTVFQWHGDTFDLPSNAIPLAENDLYLQTFKLQTAYALQFHLEVTEEMIKDWLEVYESELRSLEGVIYPDEILNDAKRYLYELNLQAREFILRWLKR